MPYYVVIRQPLKTGYPKLEKAVMPSKETLLKELRNSQQNLALFYTIESAKKIADTLFDPPGWGGLYCGFYGLIAEIPRKFSYEDTMRSGLNWICSYGYTERNGIRENALITCPSAIHNISRVYISDEAKAYNPNLQDVDFSTPSLSNTCA